MRPQFRLEPSFFRWRRERAEFDQRQKEWRQPTVACRIASRLRHRWASEIGGRLAKGRRHRISKNKLTHAIVERGGRASYDHARVAMSDKDAVVDVLYVDIFDHVGDVGG